MHSISKRLHSRMQSPIFYTMPFFTCHTAVVVQAGMVLDQRLAFFHAHMSIAGLEMDPNDSGIPNDRGPQKTLTLAPSTLWSHIHGLESDERSGGIAILAFGQKLCAWHGSTRSSPMH